MNMNSDVVQRPRPQPPEAPLPSDCCDSGCVDCIFDQYGDALRAYERALTLWEQEKLLASKSPDI
ncbi:MAG: oxidoreductase-like domain-containing protein [Oceanococcus sp.]